MIIKTIEKDPGKKILAILKKSLTFVCLKKICLMTKADLVKNIADKTGLEKKEVQKVIELFMDEIIHALSKGEAVYLRGFGTFNNKFRAQKIARNIKKNTSLVVPAHYIPSFKPSKSFVDKIKNNIKP